MTLPAAAPQRVWSLPLRLTHWTLVVLVTYNLAAETGPAHRYAGYAAVALVLARLVAGIRGDEASRLYLPRLSECANHARQILSGRAATRKGHSALGMSMSLLIWLILLMLGLSGWVSRLDPFWGEDWPIDVHSFLAQMLEAALIVHLAGVAISSRVERQNLARAMVTGYKRVDS